MYNIHIEIVSCFQSSFYHFDHTHTHTHSWINLILRHKRILKSDFNFCFLLPSLLYVKVWMNWIVNSKNFNHFLENWNVESESTTYMIEKKKKKNGILNQHWNSFICMDSVYLYVSMNAVQNNQGLRNIWIIKKKVFFWALNIFSENRPKVEQVYCIKQLMKVNCRLQGYVLFLQFTL